MEIPFIGLGTYQLQGEECSLVVEQALDLGYRHIDTAHMYENHRAIKKGILKFPRDKLFITSKFTLEQIDLENAAASIEKSCDLALEELGTSYLDLYLIHWPDPKKDMRLVLEAMMMLREKGKTRFIGVSNFNEHHLKDVLNPKVPIYANQVEFHPFLYQKNLLEYCNAHHIKAVAYRPFGKGALLKEPVFEEIGKLYKKTPSQIVLRWLIQKGIPSVPRSASIPHLKENIAVFDFELSAKDIAKIDALNQNLRYCKPSDPAFQY